MSHSALNYMPATTISSINLLGKDDFTNSPVGRLVTWATTYGRYIMVGTELIVLLAFISRFSLDRKLTDLKETISQKQSIIEANLSFENDIRLLQSTLTTTKQLMNNQGVSVDTIKTISSLLPPDVSLKSFDYTNGTAKISASAGTVEGFSTFLSLLNASKKFTSVSIPGEINKDQVLGIEFEAELEQKSTITHQ